MNIVKKSVCAAVLLCSLSSASAYAKGLSDEIAIVHLSKLFATSSTVKNFENELSLCTNVLKARLHADLEKLNDAATQLHENKDLIDEESFQMQKEELQYKHEKMKQDYSMSMELLQNMNYEILEIARSYFYESAEIAAKKYKRTLIKNGDAIIYADSKYLDLTDVVSELIEEKFESSSDIRTRFKETIEKLECDLEEDVE